MRIIAGRLGGRTFASPGTNKTHPMSERVRGALFNTLGDIENLTVLDAFAGSGALSFEAVSRGALKVLAIDNDRESQKVIEDNIKKLGVQGEVKLFKSSVATYLNTNPTTSYDLVFCDPPYHNTQHNLLMRLSEQTKKGGILVLSLPPEDHVKLSESRYAQKIVKPYGDAQLVFFERL